MFKMETEKVIEKMNIKTKREISQLKNKLNNNSNLDPKIRHKLLFKPIPGSRQLI